MNTNEPVEALNFIKELAIFRKNYSKFINKYLSDLDITLSEFAYLKEVVNYDGIPQDELIRNLQIDKAAATRIAQSLEKKNLIKRIKNENNKRFFNVFLGTEGIKYIPIINNILDDFYNLLCTDGNIERVVELTNTIKNLNSKFLI